MSAKHVDRQASQVEHEGGHHDVVGHGQDLAGGGHVGSLCVVNIWVESLLHSNFDLSMSQNQQYSRHPANFSKNKIIFFALFS